TCFSPNTTACGIAGGACTVCALDKADTCALRNCRCGANPACDANTHCVMGNCVCDGTSCPNGCCMGNVCVAPTNGFNGGPCGTGGVQCTLCVQGQACVGNACVCNGQSCPTG